MEKAYTFSDVLIEPGYSEVLSRSIVNLTSDLGKFKLELPVISSNMKTITGPNMVQAMNNMGGMGILHRFNGIGEAVDDYKQSLFTKKEPIVGVSIGVHGAAGERFNELYQEGARIFCIDVAHGHHVHVKNALKWIDDNYSDTRN